MKNKPRGLRRWMMHWSLFVATLKGCGLLISVLFLAACKPSTARLDTGSVKVMTSISADGQMVAAFDEPSGRPPRLRIKRLLPQETAWEEVSISPYISSVFFGMQGKQLLLTEVIDKSMRSVLVAWDMDKREQPPILLYEGYRLVFPMEFKPGHYLVRSCNNSRADWPCTDRGFDNQWEWVHEGKSMQVFDNERDETLLYSQPNIEEEKGFFWLTKFNQTPKIVTLQFNRQKVDASTIVFDDKTADIYCDYKTERCIDSYVSGETTDRRFIYSLRVRYQGQTCLIPKIAGFNDILSLAPNGLAAVTAYASRAELPRTVAVMRFEPGQCAPKSIHFYPFEDSKS